MKNKYLYFMAAAHLCNDINSGALPALLPFFVTFYGMDYKAVGGLMFAGSFLSSIVQPIFGYLADRVSRPWFMSFGVLLCGVSLGATSLFTNYWAIFAAVTFMGIGSSIFHPEAARLVNRISGGKKGLGMSIFSVGGNGGFGVGPLLAVALVTAFGMKGIISFAAIAILMSGALFFLVPRIKKAADRMEKYAVKISSNQETVQGENNWHAFSRLTVVIVCRSIVFCAVESFLPLFCVHVLLQSNGVGSSTLTILSLIGVVTTLIGGVLADRFGYIKVIKYCMAGLVISLVAVVMTRNIIVLYMLLIPLGFAAFASYSSYVVLGQSYLAKNIGFASGVTLGLSFSVGGIVVPSLGWFADSYGLPAVMELIVLIAGVGALGTFFLPPISKKKLNKSM
ncbi:MFS transporter [Pectinatus frisingensis]|uniref:MFS transporter n=1 Tax=Pectinatus frisingensis TaxID=865 RepID=UPI0015F51251|nr:MFS transporter [Pectinatus frisingensis]